MVTRILHAMFANGLFDKVPVDASMDLPATMLAAHAGVTRTAAEQGVVLLKNGNAVLPLAPSVRSLMPAGVRVRANSSRSSLGARPTPASPAAARP